MRGAIGEIIKCLYLLKFQSTLPMRGAILRALEEQIEDYVFQSTLPMRGAITHLHVPWCVIKFQSTLPMRGAIYWDYYRNS